MRDGAAGWILSSTSEISQSGRLGLNLNMQMGTGNGKQHREKIAFKYLHNKQQLPQTYNAMVKMAKYSFYFVRLFQEEANLYYYYLYFQCLKNV